MTIIQKTDTTKVAAPAEREDGKTNAAQTHEAEVQRKKARTLAKQQQAAERIAAASAELSSGINEAASASEEMKRASDQIAAGAEEASGAAQESMAAFKQITNAIARQSQNAEVCLSKAESSQALIGKTSATVTSLITNVGLAAERQAASVEMVGELEKQAANIGDIVKAVVRIADQTNLLALNAAIEAARAGKHGKGFAVVADEVRTLAETSEKSAKQIQDLVGQIRKDVKTIADGINTSAKTVEGEIEKGKVITAQLDQVRTEMLEVVRGVTQIATGAQQSDAVARQALKGSEDIAAASMEQSAAAEESAKTVEEQSRALSESAQAAQSLSELAEDLKGTTDVTKNAEDVSSSAEELSAAMEEINRASNMIAQAIEQIRKGTQVAATASEESVVAVTQIEKGVTAAEQHATVTSESMKKMQALLATNKTSVEELINGITASAKGTQASIKQMKDLGQVSRHIDKIVEAITTVSIQTNMLAVNGSIEAARAGEFGKGFVVVSTDIRNLARDSAENADRIKDMVKAVQDQIDLVGTDLEEIVRTAIGEAEQAKVATINLTQIEADVAEVSRATQVIQTASTEIASAIGQAKKSIEQIATAAQEAEKATVEAASAAAQQSKGAEELASAIEEISSLADELRNAA